MQQIISFNVRLLHDYLHYIYWLLLKLLGRRLSLAQYSSIVIANDSLLHAVTVLLYLPSEHAIRIV